MPISPSTPGATTMSTSPSYTRRSWLTISQRIGILGRQFLRLRDRVVNRADEAARVFGQVVVLAVEDFAEGADGFFHGHVHALAARELLGGHERLAEELLDLAGARHEQLVVFGKLVHAEDGDDGLQVRVALEHALDFEQ